MSIVSASRAFKSSTSLRRLLSEILILLSIIAASRVDPGCCSTRLSLARDIVPPRKGRLCGRFDDSARSAERWYSPRISRLVRSATTPGTHDFLPFTIAELHYLRCEVSLLLLLSDFLCPGL